MTLVLQHAPCTCSTSYSGYKRQLDRLPGHQAGFFGSPNCLQIVLSRHRGRELKLQTYAVKGKGKKQAQQMQSMGPPSMPVPPIDPNNVEFVVFVRATKFPQWFPLSVIKGSAAANTLVKSLDSEWGKKLYGKTLIRQIGMSLYRDRKNIERKLRREAPMMQNFTEFEYAFKIRDKTKPKDWAVAEHLTLLPSEKDMGTTVGDNVRKFLREKLGVGK